MLLKIAPDCGCLCYRLMTTRTVLPYGSILVSVFPSPCTRRSHRDGFVFEAHDGRTDRTRLSLSSCVIQRELLCDRCHYRDPRWSVTICPSLETCGTIFFPVLTTLWGDAIQLEAAERRILGEPVCSTCTHVTFAPERRLQCAMGAEGNGTRMERRSNTPNQRTHTPPVVATIATT